LASDFVESCICGTVQRDVVSFDVELLVRLSEKCSRICGQPRQWHALLEMPFLCKQSKQSGQKSFPDTLSDLSLLHIRSNARDKVKDNSVLP
jgi:hypothetical protein